MSIRDKKLSIGIAHSIYNILVEAGAPETNRDSFVHSYTNPDPFYGPSSEWRFCGKYGMAGKFWWNDDRFYISGHSRSEVSAEQFTEEWDEIDKINFKLAAIKAKHDEVTA